MWYATGDAGRHGEVFFKRVAKKSGASAVYGEKEKCRVDAVYGEIAKGRSWYATHGAGRRFEVFLNRVADAPFPGRIIELENWFQTQRVARPQPSMCRNFAIVAASGNFGNSLARSQKLLPRRTERMIVG